MIEVKKEGIILKKTNLGFESEGVLNPAVIRNGDNIHSILIFQDDYDIRLPFRIL